MKWWVCAWACVMKWSHGRTRRTVTPLRNAGITLPYDQRHNTTAVLPLWTCTCFKHTLRGNNELLKLESDAAAEKQAGKVSHWTLETQRVNDEDVVQTQIFYLYGRSSSLLAKWSPAPKLLKWKDKSIISEMHVSHEPLLLCSHRSSSWLGLVFGCSSFFNDRTFEMRNSAQFCLVTWPRLVCGPEPWSEPEQLRDNTCCTVSQLTACYCYTHRAVVELGWLVGNHNAPFTSVCFVEMLRFPTAALRTRRPTLSIDPIYPQQTLPTLEEDGVVSLYHIALDLAWMQMSQWQIAFLLERFTQR